MYVVRFSYAVSPVNRRKAIGYIQREIEPAGRSSLKSRLLVPITRAPGALSTTGPCAVDSCTCS